jgi:hypothetical protein
MGYDQPTKDRFWHIIRNKNWNDPAFDREKAFVASVFAEISYEHVTNAETAYHGRMIVVPCLEYYDLVSSKRSGDVYGLIKSIGDLPEPIVIEREFAVAVVVRVNDLIFVGIRGTILTYARDWLIDLNMTRGLPCSYNVRIHRGFLNAAEDLYNPLSEAIKNISGGNQDILIYLSGHSMGGAIAATLHAIWDGGFLSTFLGIQIDRGKPRSHSAYTFGMPRYTNDEGIKSLRMPHHVAHKRDFFTWVPSKKLGYADCPNPYVIDNPRLAREGKVPIAASLAPYHVIEHYRRWL